MAIFKKYYLLILTLIVLVSYGQILGMYVWRDDNAVFFKFSHLYERAGYLGIGLLGSQPYKLTVTPYYLIYKLFGTENLVPYYVLALVFYIFTTFIVYKIFTRIFSNNVGKISSFLFACGYIASEGSMWLITSITQSLSIIFVLGVLLFYEKWYGFSIVSYFLASYFTPARTHYFIVVIIFFEFLYFLKKINLFGVFRSLVRLLPFLLIFYKYIFSGDSRTGEPIFVLKQILSGDLRYLHSLISTTGQMFFPLVTNSSPLILSGIGVIFGLLVLIFFSQKKDKKDLILLSVWMLANTFAFSFLDPFGTYPATVRYLAHSFIPLIGILGILSQKNKLLMISVIIWGLVNIISSVNYQHNILKDRSEPARKFYLDLKKELPSIQKGDVIYIDVADDARGAYNAAFTVSQMPEETALAWRYGLDRYDFSLETEFPKVVNKIKENNLPLNKIHTFFYSKDGLVNTTRVVRQNLGGTGSPQALPNLQTPFTSITPTILEIELIAKPSNFINSDKAATNSVANDPSLRTLAFLYNQKIKQIRSNSSVTVNNFWQDDIGTNLNDNNIETTWRPNRVEWSRSTGSMILTLDKVTTINRFAWVNSYPNNSPTLYEIHTSLDSQNWTKISEIQNDKKIEKSDTQVVDFPAISAKYIKMVIRKSLNDDAPGIAEVWVIPSEFSKLPIQETEKFLLNPFEFVPDITSFYDSLRWLNNQGLVSVWWKNNKSNKWETSPVSRYSIIYDGLPHIYRFLIPAGGTVVNEVRLDDFQIPGEILIKNIKISYSLIYEKK